MKRIPFLQCPLMAVGLLALGLTGCMLGPLGALLGGAIPDALRKEDILVGGNEQQAVLLRVEWPSDLFAAMPGSEGETVAPEVSLAVLDLGRQTGRVLNAADVGFNDSPVTDGRWVAWVHVPPEANSLPEQVKRGSVRVLDVADGVPTTALEGLRVAGADIDTVEAVNDEFLVFSGFDPERERYVLVTMDRDSGQTRVVNTPLGGAGLIVLRDDQAYLFTLPADEGPQPGVWRPAMDLVRLNLRTGETQTLLSGERDVDEGRLFLTETYLYWSTTRYPQSADPTGTRTFNVRRFDLQTGAAETVLTDRITLSEVGSQVEWFHGVAGRWLVLTSQHFEGLTSVRIEGRLVDPRDGSWQPLFSRRGGLLDAEAPPQVGVLGNVIIWKLPLQQHWNLFDTTEGKKGTLDPFAG